MARIGLVLLLCAGARGAQAAVVVPAAPESELESVADRLHSTVIAVRARTPVEAGDGGTMDAPIYGTGVLVGGGLAVTTLHTLGEVVPGGVHASSEIEALVSEIGPVPAAIVAWFPELDLAILRLAGASSLSGPALAEEPPAQGESLIAMGTDEEAVSVVGVTVAAANHRNLLLTSSRRVDSRFWGGPVFDPRGRLVGITVLSLGQPKALSSTALRGLLDKVRQHEADATAAGPKP